MSIALRKFLEENGDINKFFNILHIQYQVCILQCVYSSLEHIQIYICNKYIEVENEC